MSHGRNGDSGGRRARRLASWGPVVLYMAVIFYLSSQPTLPQPPGALGIDKVQHLAAYFGLALLAYRAVLLLPLVCRLGTYVQAFTITGLYGVFDELHQRFVPGRTCDVFDWLADCLGALLALAVVAVVRSFRRTR